MGNKERLLVYGGSGLVGSRIVELLGKDFEIFAPGHGEVDVTDRKRLEENIEEVDPVWIIYSVGLTKMDQAEENPDLAYLLNSDIPMWIAEKCRKLGVRVCYLSTDAVFSGNKNENPYKETDKPDPTNVYGKSKLKGERNVLSVSDDNLVLRFCMPYTSCFSGKLDFVRLVIKVLGEGSTFEGIVDQIINPVFTDDLVYLLRDLIKKNSSGVYHLGSRDHLSNYDFAVTIARVMGFDEDLIKKINFDEFMKIKKIRRGRYWWLDVSKIEKEIREVSSTEEGIRAFKKNLKI